MVSHQFLVSSACLLLADVVPASDATADAPLKQLTPIDQIRVIVGLFVIIVLGVVLFIVIKAGSHMVKGLSAAANRLPQETVPNEDDWASKPLVDRVSKEGEQGCEEDD